MCAVSSGLALDGGLVDDSDEPVGPRDQAPLAPVRLLLRRLPRQGPPATLAVHDHRHLSYQVVLEL